jgi:hypothetical protein
LQVNKPSNTTEMEDHLTHVEYPISGKDFVAACDNMSHATKQEKDWVKQNISLNKTYNSQDEVKQALKI